MRRIPSGWIPSQAGTNDQDHNYGPEQTAFDGGKMDLFPLSVGMSDDPLTLATETGAPTIATTTGLTMGYYDGNTVTAMWNYAQHYALNDHSFGSTFGASTQGALNLASGQTNGVATYTTGAASGVVADGQGGYTLIGDEDPANDVCSSASANVSMSGKNIGDLLNAAGVSWGFFSGGFNLGITNSNGTTGCARSTASVSSRASVEGRLHSSPPAVPVLREHGESDAHSSGVGGGDWHGGGHRRQHGESSV